MSVPDCIYVYMRYISHATGKKHVAIAASRA